MTFDRWHLEMPAIIAKSISILSDAGLGMAMFSLGQSLSLSLTLIFVAFLSLSYMSLAFVITKGDKQHPLAP